MTVFTMFLTVVMSKIVFDMALIQPYSLSFTSLWKIMSLPKRIRTERKLCLMEMKFKLTFLIQQAKKITLPSGTIISAVEKDFYVSFQLQSLKVFNLPQTLGKYFILL